MKFIFSSYSHYVVGNQSEILKKKFPFDETSFIEISRSVSVIELFCLLLICKERRFISIQNKHYLF